MKVFLVPASEADDARAAVGNSDLKIVPVENVDDALKALAAIGGNGGDLVSTAAGETNRFGDRSPAS